ncbi:hypothetical protein GCM10009584_24100 [Ornithinimicrobium humiphilum]|uniref:Type III secretion system (T3SS) SseB-like protein n=1 Tax=Ornithinimicrobium humiphilum TaxID=125288 RepID=A0A543KMJ2_9MICO|nr:hypothetical protein [Ornithinimicrobium humiphilum]TQM96300.1 hypothetical protein FB476_1164 [Ornithinimicrobium humiphilum]
MTDPTSMPFQGEEPADGDSIYEGRRPEAAATAETPGAAEPGAGAAVPGDLLPPAQTETDLLAARVEGPEDQQGMTELWRATMALPHWWFIAVGDEGTESPAAAEIDGQLMLLTFTNAERARHFAVQNGMIGVDEDLRAIALPPAEVVASGETYRVSGIGGLMFDPHLTGYFISSEQLPVVWDAISSQTGDQAPQG